MSVQTKINFDREMITQFSQEKKEPDWMLQLRLQALDQYARLPLPKLEKTKIDNWNIDRFAPFVQQDPIQQLPDFIQEVVDENQSSLLVQKNASTVYERGAAELNEKGVIFTSLEKALQQHGDLVKRYFMKDNVKPDEHRLTALHAALWSGGVFLYVPKNTEVTVPLQAAFWSSGNGAGLVPHIIIVAEDNSSVTYVDTYASDPDVEDAVQNSIVEVYAGSGSKVRFISVRTLGEGVTDYVFRRAYAARDASVEWLINEMGEGHVVSDNSTVLQGDGSRVDTKTAAIGNGSQKENITSYVRHIGKHTDSDILSRGVMRGNATSIFNGITKIEKGAEKSNGQQAENILMLSKKARGDANPILLIDEDDVKAGHAASVGKVNDVQLYYLMSRGISKTEAERLIIHGFIHPVVKDIPSERLKAFMEKTIERKIRQ